MVPKNHCGLQTVFGEQNGHRPASTDRLGGDCVIQDLDNTVASRKVEQGLQAGLLGKQAK
jgi:hypothetical protein